MKKAIVIIRESTVRQEIESQTNEIVDYAKTFGYTEETITVIGDRGASAIKLDDLYLKNMALINQTIIEDTDVDCVFAWALDRIARKASMFMEFKDFLVEHKVNLRIKNPDLVLFNSDGTVNTGIELAMSLFATMAQQEMEMKQARFKRAKIANAAKGKFIGGGCFHLGYTTNKDGYLIIEPKEAALVKLMYNLYSSGKYSNWTLSKELNERGYKIRNKKISETQVDKILKETVYIGYSSKNKLQINYPPIIEEDLFKAVKVIRESRNKNIDKTVEKHLGTKLLKCIECGSNYVYYIGPTCNRYVCYSRKYRNRLEPANQCNSSVGIPAPIAEAAILNLTRTLKEIEGNDLNETKKKEFEARKVILLQKIDTITAEINSMDGKVAKVVDAWTENYLSEEQYKSRIDKLRSDKENLRISLKSYKDELKTIEYYLANNKVSIEEQVEHELAKLEDNIDKNIVQKFIKVGFCKSFDLAKTHFTLLMLIDYNNKIYNYVFQQYHTGHLGLYEYYGDKLIPFTDTTKIGNVEMDLNTDFKSHNEDFTKAVIRINNSPESLAELKETISIYNELALSKI